jgi:hypothetical protein
LYAAKYGGQMYSAYGGNEDSGKSWTDTEIQVSGLTKEQIRIAMNDVYGSLKMMKKIDTFMEVTNAEPFRPGQSQSGEADEWYKASGLPLVLLLRGEVWLH